jgi:glucose/mannose-6-phosphate isomerase
MLNLDSEETYGKLDPSGLRYRLRNLPHYCQEAWTKSSAVDLPQLRQTVNKVVIGGMGGSAIAGDLVADLVAMQQTVPIILVRDFVLPFALDANSLFVGCSYSGATEETISLFRQALQQNARMLAIAGGGTLVEEAKASNVPLLTIDAPGEPRSAVGYNLMLLLSALNGTGLARTTDADVRAAVTAVEQEIARCGEEVAFQENPAKQLAQDLVGRLIVIYGGGLFSALARRWKTQLNENAKAWAFFETIPEGLHNSVEAFQPSADGHEGPLLLLLQPSLGSKELESRYRAISGLLRRRGVSHQMLKGIDGPPLAQLLRMLVLGDYVSYYLALLNGVDPSPTPAIDLGKELLRDTRE